MLWNCLVYQGTGLGGVRLEGFVRIGLDCGVRGRVTEGEVSGTVEYERCRDRHGAVLSLARNRLDLCVCQAVFPEVHIWFLLFGMRAAVARHLSELCVCTRPPSGRWSLFVQLAGTQWRSAGMTR